MIRKLERKLKQLQKEGYEYITISDVLGWIANFRRERKAAQIEKRDAPLPGQTNIIEALKNGDRTEH
jgi:hypothetical protein